MTQLNSIELDSALRKLIADPNKLDEVKSQIQSSLGIRPARSRVAEARNDDFEDLFDNMPV